MFRARQTCGMIRSEESGAPGSAGMLSMTVCVSTAMTPTATPPRRARPVTHAARPAGLRLDPGSAVKQAADPGLRAGRQRADHAPSYGCPRVQLLACTRAALVSSLSATLAASLLQHAGAHRVLVHAELPPESSQHNPWPPSTML